MTVTNSQTLSSVANKIFIETAHWNQLSSIQKNQIRDIFFETSSVRNFQSEIHKESFLRRWLTIYFDSPDQSFFYLARKANQIVGYCVGAYDTRKFHTWSIEFQTLYFEHFNNYWDQFPCHLHINVKASAHGCGIGTRLIQRVCFDLKENGHKGLHIVTNAGAQNVSFYQRNGFSFSDQKEYQGFELLFLGCQF